MQYDIKKIDKIDADFTNEFSSWLNFITWIRSTDNTETIFKGLIFEMRGRCRPAFIDRLRTRFNKLRALEELRIIEEITDKVISIHYV